MGGGPIHFKTFYSILDSKRLSAHSQTQVDGDRTPKSGIFVSLDVVGVCRARTWRVSIGAPPAPALAVPLPGGSMPTHTHSPVRGGFIADAGPRILGELGSRAW